MLVSPRTYTCHYVEHDFPIDGNELKHPWVDVGPLELVDTVTGGVTRLRTLARVVWSSKYLYVLFSGEDVSAVASLHGFNEPLYDEDVVEVFIDDNQDLKTYVEVEVNPLNAVLHHFVFNDLSGHTISYARTEQTIISSVARREKDMRWDVEIAIPFSELLSAPNIPPLPGDIWSINFYRIDRDKHDQSKDEYSAWSPTGQLNYHVPSCFGQLRFTDEPTVVDSSMRSTIRGDKYS